MKTILAILVAATLPLVPSAAQTRRTPAIPKELEQSCPGNAWLQAVVLPPWDPMTGSVTGSCFGSVGKMEPQGEPGNV